MYRVCHGWTDVLMVLLGPRPLLSLVCVTVGDCRNLYPFRKTDAFTLFFSHSYPHIHTNTYPGFHASVTVSANCSPFAPPLPAASVCQFLCLPCPSAPLHARSHIYHFRLSPQSCSHLTLPQPLYKHISSLVMPCIGALCSSTRRRTEKHTFR